MFTTDSFPLAAFLTLRGHDIVGTHKCASGFTAFDFQQSPELDRDVADFHGEGAVPAREYMRQVNQLKRRYLPRTNGERGWNRNG